MPAPRQFDLSEGERDRAELLREIENFLATCTSPALMEPGEPVLHLIPGEFTLEASGNGVLIECWSGERVLRRRLRRIRKRLRNRLELDSERFPRQRGTLSLVDLQSPVAPRFEQESQRGVAREQLRHWCERIQPGWRIECLSAAPDLERSLSPRFPRALLRLGSDGICAISAPDEECAEDIFTFGLIWLQHCRDRWRAVKAHTLMLFAPEPAASAIALRLLACNHARLRYRLIAHSPDGVLRELTPRVWGNLCARFTADGHSEPANEQARQLFEAVAAEGEAECVYDQRGVVSLELHGLPLARSEGDDIRTGLRLRPADSLPSFNALLRLAVRVGRIRNAQSPNTRHVLYRLYPERWLESVVRQQIRTIDPTLHPQLVRRQITGSLGTHRTRTDLLALDESGRLVVIEIKADSNIQLPAQAVDYYSRLKLLMERDGSGIGTLFPGHTVQPVAPRVLLVAPALCFHPANETVLDYLESSIAVRQVGIALEWRKQLRVVFQHPLGEPQRGGSARWPAIFSSKLEKPSPR